MYNRRVPENSPSPERILDSRAEKIYQNQLRLSRGEVLDPRTHPTKLVMHRPNNRGERRTALKRDKSKNSATSAKLALDTAASFISGSRQTKHLNRFTAKHDKRVATTLGFLPEGSIFEYEDELFPVQELTAGDVALDALGLFGEGGLIRNIADNTENKGETGIILPPNTLSVLAKNLKDGHNAAHSYARHIREVHKFNDKLA